MQTLRHLCLRLALLLPALISLPAGAGGDVGERLHNTHCLECHGTDIYTRPGRIVNSFPELKTRISQCELSNDLAWFDEEIDAVATYLNENFYRFEAE